MGTRYNLCFEQKYEKYQRFSTEKFHFFFFFQFKKSLWRVFVMGIFHYISDFFNHLLHVVMFALFQYLH